MKGEEIDVKGFIDFGPWRTPE